MVWTQLHPYQGHAPVAVVVPTYTWQAYNRRGGDRADRRVLEVS